MKSCGARSEIAALISPKVVDGDVAEVDLSEGHGPSVNGRLGGLVEVVDENTHPLFSSSVSVDSAARLASRLDLNSELAGLNRRGRERCQCFTVAA